MNDKEGVIKNDCSINRINIPILTLQMLKRVGEGGFISFFRFYPS